MTLTATVEITNCKQCPHYDDYASWDGDDPICKKGAKFTSTSVMVACCPFLTRDVDLDHDLQDICFAYESGYGHGYDLRGLRNPFTDPNQKWAYDYGCSQGAQRRREVDQDDVVSVNIANVDDIVAQGMTIGVDATLNIIEKMLDDQSELLNQETDEDAYAYGHDAAEILNVIIKQINAELKNEG